MYKRLTSLTVLIAFLATSVYSPSRAYAAPLLGLPEPGTMVSLSSTYQPALIKGITLDPKNPFLFDFIIDTGDDTVIANEVASLRGAQATKQSQQEQLKAESTKLIKYFLAALTIPEKDLWVNLSPYEKDRMLPQNLSQTEMGRDMLAQDYLLKQITASLIYPEKELGKSFWDKVYAKSQALYGTTQIPVNTFNKVWIVADKADVFERNQTAFVMNAHLKVMLEEDYLAKSKNEMPTRGHVQDRTTGNVSPSTLPREPGLSVKATQGTNVTPNVASQIIRDIIIPELEKEVNEGKNFAPLRQMFHSMILASWFKLALKDAVMTQLYGNQGKVGVGVTVEDKQAAQKIYDRYVQAYKKGVFNYIKEDPSLRSASGGEAISKGTTIPRKYFSGGVAAFDPAMIRRNTTLDAARKVSLGMTPGGVFNVSAAMTNSDKAAAGVFDYLTDAIAKKYGHNILQDKKVLVLDDNTISFAGMPSIRDLMLKILMSAGARVVFPNESPDDQKIVDAIQQHKFDLIITNFWRNRHSQSKAISPNALIVHSKGNNMNSPNGNGAELSRMFAGTVNADTPVMFTSASSTEEIQAWLGDRLPTGTETPSSTRFVHLQKPFGVDPFMKWAIFMTHAQPQDPSINPELSMPEPKALPAPDASGASAAMATKALASGSTIVLQYPGTQIVVDAHTVVGKATLAPLGDGHLLKFDGNGKGESGMFFIKGLNSILAPDGNFENGKLVSFEIGKGYIIISNNIGHDIDITTDAKEINLGKQALVPEAKISLRGGNKVRFYEAATKLKYIFMAAGLFAFQAKANKAVRFLEIADAVSGHMELIPGEQGAGTRVPGRFSRAEAEWPTVALNQFNQWMAQQGIAFDAHVYMLGMNVIEHMRHADAFKNSDGAEEILFSDILTGVKADTQQDKIIATAALKALATKFGLLTFDPDVSAAMSSGLHDGTYDDVTIRMQPTVNYRSRLQEITPEKLKESRRKFDDSGRALPFNGLTVMAGLEDDQLVAQMSAWQNELTGKLGKVFKPVSKESLHMTLLDLPSTINDDGVKPVDENGRKLASEQFAKIRRQLEGINFVIQGLGVITMNAPAVIARVRPATEGDWDKLVALRKQIHNQMGLLVGKAVPPFIGHITLGYLTGEMVQDAAVGRIPSIGNVEQVTADLNHFNMHQTREAQSTRPQWNWTPKRAGLYEFTDMNTFKLVGNPLQISAAMATDQNLMSKEILVAIYNQLREKSLRSLEDFHLQIDYVEDDEGHDVRSLFSSSTEYNYQSPFEYIEDQLSGGLTLAEKDPIKSEDFTKDMVVINRRGEVMSLEQIRRIQGKPSMFFIRDEDTDALYLLVDVGVKPQTFALPSRLMVGGETLKYGFGTSGVRGFGTFIRENNKRLVAGIAKYLENVQARSFVIGFDTREHNGINSKEAASILAAQDSLEVVYVFTDYVPTPVVAYFTNKLKTDGNINYTASHNPADYNGIKFSQPDGGAVPDSVSRAITLQLNNPELTEYKTVDYDQAVKQGRIVEISAQEAIGEYVGYVVSRLNKTMDRKGKSLWDNMIDYLVKHPQEQFLADAMEGTSGPYIKELFQRIDQAVRAKGGAGFRNKLLHETPSSEFLKTRTPEEIELGKVGAPQPSPPRLIELSKKVAAAQGKAIGFAGDGDTDRVLWVDENGKIKIADNMLAILAYHLKLYVDLPNFNVVAKTFVTSDFVRAVAEHVGLEVIDTGVGFKYLATLTREGVATVLTGEESAHLSIPGIFEMSWDDGIAVGIMSLVVKSMLDQVTDLTDKTLVGYLNYIQGKALKPGEQFIKRTFDSRHDETIKKAVIVLTNYTYAQIDGGAVEGDLLFVKQLNVLLEGKGFDVQSVEIAYADTKDTKMRDGVQVKFSNGDRVILRRSGTEPIAKASVDARDIGRAQVLLDAMEALIVWAKEEYVSGRFKGEALSGSSTKSAAMSSRPSMGIKTTDGRTFQDVWDKEIDFLLKKYPSKVRPEIDPRFRWRDERFVKMPLVQLEQELRRLLQKDIDEGTYFFDAQFRQSSFKGNLIQKFLDILVSEYRTEAKTLYFLDYYLMMDDDSIKNLIPKKAGIDENKFKELLSFLKEAQSVVHEVLLEWAGSRASARAEQVEELVDARLLSKSAAMTAASDTASREFYKMLEKIVDDETRDKLLEEKGAWRHITTEKKEVLESLLSFLPLSQDPDNEKLVRWVLEEKIDGGFVESLKVLLSLWNIQHKPEALTFIKWVLEKEVEKSSYKKLSGELITALLSQDRKGADVFTFEFVMRVLRTKDSTMNLLKLLDDYSGGEFRDVQSRDERVKKLGIIMPVDRIEDYKAQRGGPGVVGIKGKEFLIISDDTLVPWALEDSLKKAGARGIVRAKKSMDSIIPALNSGIDLIIFDGFRHDQELIVEVRKLNRNIRLLVLTGDVEYETHAAFERAHNLTLFPKPTKMEGFLEAIIKKLRESQAISESTKGGIDFDANKMGMNVSKEGAGVDITFDPAMVERMKRDGFDGFIPVIINITPVISILPLLGLAPRREEEEGQLAGV